MAHVEKRGPGRWRARYAGPDGKERSRTFPRKVDADRFLLEVQTDLVRGTYVDQTDRTTVADYARSWAAQRPHRPATARRVALTIEKHFAGTELGGRPLVAVRPSEVQAWANGRAQVLAPSTLRITVRLLASVYAAAVLDRRVASSPVVRLALPTSTRAKVVPLTVDQVDDLARAVRRQYVALVLLQAGTGLRIGELLAVRACDVDFLRRSVRVEHQLEAGTGRRVEPKTAGSRRTVPLPTVTAEALAEHLARWPAVGEQLLFRTDTGTARRHDAYSQVFTKAAARAGLPAGTTTHDLRHHYASVLLAAGESVVAVAERLGHDSAALVLTTYGHLMPNQEDRTRRAVDEAWSAVRRPADGLAERSRRSEA